MLAYSITPSVQFWQITGRILSTQHNCHGSARHLYRSTDCVLITSLCYFVLFLCLPELTKDLMYFPTNPKRLSVTWGWTCSLTPLPSPLLPYAALNNVVYSRLPH